MSGVGAGDLNREVRPASIDAGVLRELPANPRPCRRRPVL